MENFKRGLILMVVGMVTVFVILLIVIYLGKLLIALVNKYIPEDAVPVKAGRQGPAAVPGHVMAVLAAAVNVVTGGKGKVSKVERL